MVTGPTKGEALVAIGLVLANVVLLLATAHFGRRIHIDETWYKAAGLHWRNGEGFRAPELTGSWPARVPAEVLFASQPPGYPFTFGVFAWVFGFGPTQLFLFDGLIRVALSLSLYVLLRSLGLRRGWAAGPPLLVWLFGYAGRPDELAVSLGLLAVWVTHRGQGGWRSAVGAGMLWGLCAATSLGAAITFCLVLVALARWPLGGGRAMPWPRVLVAGGVSLAVFACAVAPIWIAHPGSVDQLRANAAAAMGSGAWLREWRNTLRPDNPATPAAALATLFLAGTMIRGALRRPSNTRGLAPVAACLLALVFVWVRLPGKYTYLWMAMPITTAVLLHWLVLGSGSSLGPRRRLCLVAGTLLLLAPFALHPLKDVVLLLRMEPAQRLQSVAEPLQRLIPSAAIVLADEHWVVLASDREVYDAYFAGDRVLDRVEYVVRSGNFAGAPGVPRPLRPPVQAYLEQHFELISDTLPTTPPKWGGVRIGRSTLGYGSVVYRRNSGAAASAKKGGQSPFWRCPRIIGDAEKGGLSPFFERAGVGGGQGGGDGVIGGARLESPIR